MRFVLWELRSTILSSTERSFFCLYVDISMNFLILYPV